MDGWSFGLHVVQAFAIVALLLAGLIYLGRTFQRGRLVAGGRRLVTTIESTALAQNVTVHVLRVGERYYLVGGGSAGIALLSELPAAEVEPFVDLQRAALTAQRETLMRPFARFKR